MLTFILMKLNIDIKIINLMLYIKNVSNKYFNVDTK